MNKVAVHIDYTKIGFFNSNYYQSIDDKTLKNNGGAGLTLERRFWLFRIDVGGFYTSYSSEWNTSEEKLKFNIYGFDAFVSYLPMPDWGKISKIIVPSIGIGYHMLSLKPEGGDPSIDKGDIKSSFGVGGGGPLWKAGLQINLGTHFFINGEYKQSLLIDKDKAMNAFTVGLGSRW